MAKKKRSAYSKRSVANGVSRAGKKAVKAIRNAASSAAANVSGAAAASALATSLTAKAPNGKNGHLDPNATDASEFFKKLKTTADVRVSDKLVDQIIGQERGTKIIRKAATQKRNVLLVGYPGTGKSMLAQAMSELLPIEELQDVLVKPNPVEENNPVVEVLKAGEGKKRIDEERSKKQFSSNNFSLVYIFVLFILSFLLVNYGRKEFGDVITAALLIGLFAVAGVMILGMQLGRGRMFQEGESVKLLIDNSDKTKAPFIEATGARAGSLLGDVRHDPFRTIVEGKLVVQRGKKFVEVEFKEVWKKIAAKYPLLIDRRESGYEAISLPKKEKLFVLGLANGKVVKTRIYSLNRRPYDGEAIEVNAGERSVTTTPEHAFILKAGDKPANKIKKGDIAIVLEELGLIRLRRASAC